MHIVNIIGAIFEDVSSVREEKLPRELEPHGKDIDSRLGVRS
jgi:hypothetical protein